MSDKYLKLGIFLLTCSLVNQLLGSYSVYLFWGSGKGHQKSKQFDKPN